MSTHRQDANPPNQKKTKCEEYKKLLSRAPSIFNEIRNLPIQCQNRRKPRKKSYSQNKVNWMNWLAFELIESLSDVEKCELVQVNSVLYSVAAVMTFKEGEEFALDHPKKIEKKGELMRKCIIEKKISELRREADIQKAATEGKVKSEKAKSFLQNVVRKYRLDGSRAAMMKTLYSVKEKISLQGCKIRQYEKQIKAKEQNEIFAKD